MNENREEEAGKSSWEEEAEKLSWKELRDSIFGLKVLQEKTSNDIHGLTSKFEETDRIMKERSRENDRLIKERSRENDRRSKEIDRIIEENAREADRRSKETDRIIEENAREADRRLKEADRRLKETDRKRQETEQESKREWKELKKQIGGLGEKFGGFTEGMAFPSMEKILREIFHADVVSTRVKSRKNGTSMELDVLAYSNSDRNEVFIVEVKSYLREESVEQMLRILRDFPTFFPIHQDKKLYGIMAGVDIQEPVRNRILKKGLYLAQIHDEVFSLQLPPDFQPISFQ